ncbi:hypothetical protein [Acidithiobacillus ferrivorans]|uniref:hypothetical protein n=1 Tax=Acidithiobacillus ferrivorans TaxID=160808 RepID=UPI001680BF4C|nr:hypothetical protein [Acidithiobacillus ferrivorans]
MPYLSAIFLKKYRAAPAPYLQAVVYHAVGHWRDPLVWLSFLVISVMLCSSLMLAT